MINDVFCNAVDVFDVFDAFGVFGVIDVLAVFGVFEVFGVVVVLDVFGGTWIGSWIGEVGLSLQGLLEVGHLAQGLFPPSR